MRISPRSRFVLITAVTSIAAACAVKTHPRVSPSKMAELWQMPADIERRDLLHGPGGREHAPDPNGRYELLEADHTGFSPGYDVRDARGRKWSVKLGPEARTEVVVSRIVWGVGYHQPDIYYLPRWTLVGSGKTTVEKPGRFRLERPDRPKKGEWSWRENPYIGTPQLAGLFTLMVIVNNWDIKTAQNAVYRLSGDEDGDGDGDGDGVAPRQWYVVKDLGASLGKTSWFLPGNRDDVEAFEQEPFIAGVEGNRVKFHYRGAWLEPQLNTIVTPGDVVWICDLLSRLSPRQWHDAFRAGGYTDAEAGRFIARIRQKIDEGLKLRERAG